MAFSANLCLPFSAAGCIQSLLPVLSLNPVVKIEKKSTEGKETICLLRKNGASSSSRHSKGLVLPKKKRKTLRRRQWSENLGPRRNRSRPLVYIDNNNKPKKTMQRDLWIHPIICGAVPSICHRRARCGRVRHPFFPLFIQREKTLCVHFFTVSVTDRDPGVSISAPTTSQQ